MSVRLLGDSEHESVRQVVAVFKSIRDAQRAVHPGGSTPIWVAEDAGVIVGWCCAHELARPDGGRQLLIYELEVAPDARRRGHGRALVTSALEWAADRGHRNVWLLADVDNDAAQALYEAVGGNAEPQIMFSWNPPAV